MIRKIDFERLDFQVQQEIKTTFAKACNESKNNDYLLFLSNAQYVENLAQLGHNPHVVDYWPDKRHDSFRLGVLMEYINANYSFSGENTVDSHLSLTLELMIYSHLWESKPFLKQLFRMAQLTNGLDYLWDYAVRSDKKYLFISEIRKMFEKADLGISRLMSDSYISSLRNAFAHSEYYFAFGDPKIVLTNYVGKHDYEIENISYDDWTYKFCKSFLIGFYFQNIMHSERISLESGREYDVVLRSQDGNKTDGVLIYDADRDSFRAIIKKKTAYIS
jgi:hypothetical protein